MNPRCLRCGGTTLASVLIPTLAPGAAGPPLCEITCMLCGHDNLPPFTIAELRAREKPEKRALMMGDDGRDVPRQRGAQPIENLPPSQLPQIVSDGTYDRFVVSLAWMSERCVARDFVTAWGITPGTAGACLRRAKAEGLVRDIEKQCMPKPHKGLVAVWEVISSAPASRKEAA
jgi:hypothetical protein